MRLSDATQRDLKTEEALKQVVDLNYDETPFSEIMEELEKKSNLNFMLHDSARDDSLTEDEPLTFRVSQLPLNKCLELMLVQKNAAYTIDEGVVVIISRDAAPDTEFMRLKMFDCRELVDVLPASVPIYPSILSTDGSIGGMGGGLFCIPQGSVPSGDGDPILGLIGISEKRKHEGNRCPHSDARSGYSGPRSQRECHVAQPGLFNGLSRQLGARKWFRDRSSCQRHSNCSANGICHSENRKSA